MTTDDVKQNAPAAPQRKLVMGDAELRRYAKQITGVDATLEWMSPGDAQLRLQAHKPTATLIEHKHPAAVVLVMTSGSESWALGSVVDTPHHRDVVRAQMACSLVHERDKCTCNGGACAAWRRELGRLRGS
jgi:hypothetical protein